MRLVAAALLLAALSCSPVVSDPQNARPVTSTASSVVFRDLVSVWTNDGLRMIAMPGAEVLRDLDLGMQWGETGVPSDVAFLKVTKPEADNDWRTSIERVDLATGSTTLRIDAGAVQRPSWATTWALESIRSHGTLVTVPAAPSTVRWPVGRQVLLIRGEVDEEPGIRVDRFDSRTGAQLGTKQFKPLAADGLVSLRALDGDGHRYLLARARVTEQRSLVRGEWTFLDEELNEIETLSSDRLGFDLANCSAELFLIPTHGEWVTQCFEKELDSGVRLRFLDVRTLRHVGSLDLPRSVRVGEIDYVGSLGSVAAWIPSDDALTLLMDALDMPVVVRIDLRTRSVIDARRVSQRVWLPSFELFPVQVALAKMLVIPRVQVSSDGRLAYQVGLERGNDVRIIDLTAATLVAKITFAAEIHGIHLSPDGARLYVLHAKDARGNPAALSVLDARTGLTLSTNDLIGVGQAILAVATRQ